MNERLEPQILRAVEDDDVLRLSQIIITSRAQGRLNDQLLSIALTRSAEKGKLGATQYLLEQGANVVGARVTPLLKAVEKNNVAIVQLLLRHGADVETRDKKGRTPLMTAAWKNNWHILDLLLKNGADVNAKDARNRNVLHNLAADKQCDWGDAVLDLILAQDVDINGQDSLQRTPLHWACVTGKARLADILLARPSNTRAKVDATEIRDKTSLHFAAIFDHVDIVELLLRYKVNVHCKSDGGWTPLHNAAERGSASVVRLLLAAGADVNVRLLNESTPLHLAAQGGHLEVLECLLGTPGIKTDPRDAFGNTPLHRAAQNSHTDCVRILAPSVSAVSKDALAACHGFNATTISFGNFRNGNRVERPTVYDLLYGDDPSNPSKARPIWSQSKGTEFQWIHLPANNISWVQTLFTKSFIENGAQDVEYLKSLEQTFTHQHRGQTTQSYFMRSMCQTLHRSSKRISNLSTMEEPPTITTSGSPDRPRSSATDNRGNQRYNGSRESSSNDVESSLHTTPGICVFMPYLHFETNRRYQEMQESIELAKTPESPTHCKPFSSDELQVRAYLNTGSNSSPAMHIRKTLDQCFYHNSARSRDQDQVVYRYQLKENGDAKGLDPTLIMVDQLWMWLLDDCRIVTAFPQRWQQPKDDPLNLLNGIIDHVNSKARDRVKSVYDLAMIITEKCSSILDDRASSPEKYQFFKMFEASIGSANDREAALFKEFNTASIEASAWLEKNRRIGGGPDPEDPDHDVSSSKAVDKLLYIGQETNLLSETKDIRDELNMLTSVYEDQMRVLPNFQDAIYDVYRDQRQGPIDIQRRFANEHRRIETRVKDLDRMDKQTQRIYSSVLDMLDLKQKHAANTNVFEARFAREQAEGSARQNQTLMVFTIVTIIFLPLSFIAAFFTINIGEFQKSPDNTLSLAYVSKWVFGVGLAISIPLVVLALNLDKIVRYLKKSHLRAEKRREKRRKAMSRMLKGDDEGEGEGKDPGLEFDSSGSDFKGKWKEKKKGDIELGLKRVDSVDFHRMRSSK